MNTYFAMGNYNIICDRTGFKIKASNAKKEWQNLIVRRDSFELRHPQDFVRGVRDNPGVRNARPRGELDFLTVNEITPDDL